LFKASEAVPFLAIHSLIGSMATSPLSSPTDLSIPA